MRRERSRRTLIDSGVRLVAVLLLCLAAGPLIPGSAPAAPVPDRVIGSQAAAPRIEFASPASPAPVSSAEHRPQRSPTPRKSGSDTRPARTVPADRSPQPTDGTRAARPTGQRHGAGPATTPSRPPTAAVPQIAPSAALRVRVPAIDVDAEVVPVDSTPTGATNAFGGPVYAQIEFPVDGDVRQWVQRGDPNSLAPERSTDVAAFDRVVLYGHASDIGHHLVFQDLSRLTLGDRIVVTTAEGTFGYRVTLVATHHKADLDQMPELYDYPDAGRKEIALVACLPDTSSNTVVIAALTDAHRR